MFQTKKEAEEGRGSGRGRRGEGTEQGNPSHKRGTYGRSQYVGGCNGKSGSTGGGKKVE